MGYMAIIDVLDEADQQLMAMGGVIEMNCGWCDQNSGQKPEHDFQLHMLIVLKEMVKSVRAKIDDASLTLVLRAERERDGEPEEDEDEAPHAAIPKSA